ncbi:MAG: hypothetical protein Q8M98_06950 [Candidatus Cloacimonadaceae bacterium]|nr:hypothetical protein [Candidatus Cloacimonadaceae bacterium]MDP3114498.1 hypothetical protein [Candidatus Cloacimonadaceae bacterium]
MKDKKELAALSAVMAMINSEARHTFVPRIPAEVPNPWEASGRQYTMQYRDIVQRRLIKRSR